MARHCAAMVEFQDARRGRLRLRQQPAHRGARPAASSARSPTPASCRRTCGRCSAAASARSAGWRSSGEPDDIAATDAAMRELFPENARLQRWLDQAGQRIAFQGLPARICWIGYGDRHRAGLRFNELVRSGEVTAPIVIGRDHLDSGSVASPYRETEAMRDGSDAIADWPILNAMLNVASRRGVGRRPPRRRRRHRPLDPRRRAGRRRRHRRRRAAAGARADQRPRHRRHAPRARGLRRGARARPRDGPRPRRARR